MRVFRQSWIRREGVSTVHKGESEGVRIDLEFINHFAKKTLHELRYNIRNRDDMDFVEKMRKNGYSEHDTDGPLLNGSMFNAAVLIYDWFYMQTDLSVKIGSAFHSHLQSASNVNVAIDGGYAFMNLKLEAMLEHYRWSLFLLV